MSYIYTQVNRLQQPHAYMYTPFQGQSILQAFHASRAETLKQLSASGYRLAIDDDADYEIRCISALLVAFESASADAVDRFRHEIESLRQTQPKQTDNAAMAVRADSLPEFRVDDRVSTLDLLKALIASLLLGRHESVTKGWLDRLVQRFEVTKKLYEVYPAGFRKGEGSNEVVKLYWLFSLALSLYYTNTQQLKYLSTLLKVNDLLCSLPENMHADCVSSEIMSVILINEMISVELLAKQRRIQCS